MFFFAYLVLSNVHNIYAANSIKQERTSMGLWMPVPITEILFFSEKKRVTHIEQRKVNCC